MLFVFLPKHLEFSLSVAESICPFLYWDHWYLTENLQYGKWSIKWYYGIFNVNYLTAHMAKELRQGITTHRMLSLLFWSHTMPCSKDQVFPASGKSQTCRASMQNLFHHYQPLVFSSVQQAAELLLCWSVRIVESWGGGRISKCSSNQVHFLFPTLLLCSLALFLACSVRNSLSARFLLHSYILF